MMTTARAEPVILFIGDIVSFFLSLWITLVVRYGEIPPRDVLYNHLVPFSVLFVVWVVVFYLAGLYGKHTLFFRARLPQIIFTTHFINIALAALFFFFIPIFGISPKTNLVIYLLVSSTIIVSWRLLVFPRLGIRSKYKAMLIASGIELGELREEIDHNIRYDLKFTEVIDLGKGGSISVTNLREKIIAGHIQVVILDTRHPLLASAQAELSTLVHHGVRFMDFIDVYEGIFDRIPLSSLRDDWFVEYGSSLEKPLYDMLKRATDIMLSLLLSLLLVVLIPLVALATKLEDGGPVFIVQRRMGRGMRVVNVYKFRSMRSNESASSVWVGESSNRVTRVGALLRITSIDELPQVLSILKGDLSLIGPRSDIEGLAKRLQEAIPYYTTRYLITPGISGWAQINQRYAPGKISPQTIEESKIRLAYDLYYLKYRSWFLDAKIVLRTFGALLARLGA